MTATLPRTDIASYAMSLGDDALVLSQRLAEWVTRAPTIEEDVALANISLDLLGQARYLLAYAGQQEGLGRDEDALAYLRDDTEFLNVQLVEQPCGDFASTIARQLLFSAYQCSLYDALIRSTDTTIAAIAAKAAKETRYHRDHATQWVLRLGDGTDESHERLRAAVEAHAPYVDELFVNPHATHLLILAGVAVEPVSFRESCLDYVGGVLKEVGLAIPGVARPAGGGRIGNHSAHLACLLGEMQELHRAYPGVAW